MPARRPAVLARVVPSALLAGLLALVGGLLVVPAPAAQAATGPRYAVITFHKNYRDTHRSTLTWEVFRKVDGKRRTVERREWRAGSGYFRDSTNACRRNNGWLPSGTYRPRLFRDYPGRFIKGRAIYLGQKRCADGTLRRDLFIHTEQGAGSRQCPDRKGDQVCRWEYPRFNDYRSYGCVKVTPKAMRQLYDAWARWFRVGSSDRVIVRVR
jgi:hypothetical protein